MQMLLPQRVLVLLLMLVLTGLTKQIVRNGMHTEDVHGVEETVLHSTETNFLANQILDVPGPLLIVVELEHMTSHHVSLIVDVLGQIILETVQVLMK